MNDSHVLRSAGQHPMLAVLFGCVLGVCFGGCPDDVGLEDEPTVSECGNAVTEDGEQCDDGNGVDTDGCLNSCVLASCGDGVVNTGIEECDEVAVWCDSDTCMFAACGPDSLNDPCDDEVGCTVRSRCDGNGICVGYSDVYRDEDDDNYGIGEPIEIQGCTPSDGQSSRGDDCNDGASTIYPGADEICDNVDNDCSDSTPLDFGCDDDNDGYCDVDMEVVGFPSVCSNGGGDCHDGEPDIHPEGDELCDGFNNDCDDSTAIDVGCDDDSDGYCDIAMTVVGSPAVCGDGGGDCDDTKPSVHPTAAEVCDDLDNDCSEATVIDEGCDNDGDDYCDIAMVLVGTPATCSLGGGDCDDERSSVFPSGPELCDDLNNDCLSETAVDVGCDDDGDDYCDDTMTIVGTPGVCPNGGGDCDDALLNCVESCVDTDGDDDCDNRDTCPSCFDVSGDVFGLTGIGLEIELDVDGTLDSLTLEAGSETFVFADIPSGHDYQLNVVTQPSTPTQICSILNGSGVTPVSHTDDIVIICLGEVSPLYPSFGADWNDYLANDGVDRLSATDSVCDPATHLTYGSCLHGGEVRVVPMPGLDSCDDLTLSDELGAFVWTCDASSYPPIRAVSTALSADHNLSDLVLFPTQVWRSNRLVITDGVSINLETPLSEWWDNPVVLENTLSEPDGGTTDGILDAAGTVYLITSGDHNRPFRIQADSIALVVQPGVVRQGDGGTSSSNMVEANGPDFLWVEGSFDGSDYGVHLISSHHSMLRNIRVAVNGMDGVWLEDSNANMLYDIRVAQVGINVFLDSALYNTISKVTVISGYPGLYYDNANNNVFTQGTALFADGTMFDFDGAGGNVVSHVTIANGDYNGIFAYNTTDTTILAAAMINNGRGITLQYSDRVHFEDLVSASLTYSPDLEVLLNTCTDVTFGGFFKTQLARSCTIMSCTRAGLDEACADVGDSDTVRRTVETNDTVFIGATSDSVNARDNVDGEALKSAIASHDGDDGWNAFENIFRAWGTNGASYISTDRGGCWSSSATCQIWDWRLRPDDLGDRGPDGIASNPDDEPVLFGALTVPDGNDVLSHSWVVADSAECDLIPGASWVAGCSISTYLDQPSCETADAVWNQCRTTFLVHAIEILLDGVGNENGLCESGETCLYTPNIGSYQGEGDLTQIGLIGTGGVIENVTLMQFANNGPD